MNHKITSTSKGFGRNFSYLSGRTQISSSPQALSTMPKRPSHLNPTQCGATAIGEENVVVKARYPEKRKKFHHDPSWSVPSLTSSLPSIPFLHVPSPTCALFLNITDPNVIANAIVNVVTSLSSIGDYDDQYVSIYSYAKFDVYNMVFPIRILSLLWFLLKSTLL